VETRALKISGVVGTRGTVGETAMNCQVLSEVLGMRNLCGKGLCSFSTGEKVMSRCYFCYVAVGHKTKTSA
jgi:hypothetical protein